MKGRERVETEGERRAHRADDDIVLPVPSPLDIHSASEEVAAQDEPRDQDPEIRRRERAHHRREHTLKNEGSSPDG